MDINTPKQIDADPVFMVHLTQTMKAEQWEVLLQLLSKGPYEIVSPLIQSIVSQIMSQSNPPGQEQVDHVQSN